MAGRAYQLQKRRLVPANHGAIAQLGERLPCKQEAGGSTPPGSTNSNGAFEPGKWSTTEIWINAHVRVVRSSLSN